MFQGSALHNTSEAALQKPYRAVKLPEVQVSQVRVVKWGVLGCVLVRTSGYRAL